jgi:hypothetical protein
LGYIQVTNARQGGQQKTKEGYEMLAEGPEEWGTRNIDRRKRKKRNMKRGGDVGL